MKILDLSLITPFEVLGLGGGKSLNTPKKYFDPDNMIQSTFDDSESEGW